MTPPEQLSLDPTAGDADVAAVRLALAGGDWPAAVEVIARLRGDTRTTLIDIVGADADRDFLAAVHAADPGDTTAAALLGTRMINDAWTARTALRAKHVSAERFARFHATLREAEDMLVETCALDASDPAIWTARLSTARGLELGQSEARRRYDRLAALDPYPVSGQRRLLQQLCAKWGGSIEAMHAFAAEATSGLPDGAHGWVLIADAQFEHMQELLSNNRRETIRSRASRAVLRAAADRSVLHPSFAHTLGWVDIANTFAMVLTFAGELRRAHQVFTMIGPWVGERPWSMFDGNPKSQFLAMRARAAGPRRFLPW
jgi:hypothetical protein